jgi:ankyrin repeat protein
VEDEVYAAMRQGAAVGCLAIVRVVLEELGGDVNGGWTRDHMIMTPLHAAVANGHVAVVEYLIARGAYLYVCTAELVNPMHLAATRPDTTMLRLFIAQNVKILIQDARKQSPLHFAARAGSVECCRFLAPMPKQKVESCLMTLLFSPHGFAD